jgi:hypothetical protein
MTGDWIVVDGFACVVKGSVPTIVEENALPAGYSWVCVQVGI